MKRLFFLILFFVSCSTFAQVLPNPFKKQVPWHRGSVVLHNGDTVQSHLRFTRKVSEGLLQLRKGRKVEVLTVKDVRSFSYYDKKKKRTRTFFTLSLRPDLATREHEVFIEYIYGNNRLSLLNYRALGFAENTFQISPFLTKTVVNKRYLLDNATGKILPLTKENILALMEDERKEIQTYIQNSGMRLKTIDDYISLLAYHQTLIAGL